MRFVILQNEPLNASVYHLHLAGDTGAIARPGQFVQAAVPGRFLRRPLSVCDWREGALDLIYKVVGEGTRDLSGLRPGAALDVLCGLGNGYDLDVKARRPALIGGGVGAPPLYGLAKRLLADGREIEICLGFNTASDAFWLDAFFALGAPVRVATLDESLGQKGFATDLPASADYVYACGPWPMLRAAHGLGLPGQYSLEERMACGFGACMGCTIQTAAGPRRVCKDGPVFRGEDILW